MPPLPEAAIDATEVPTTGPEPAYGSRYDFLIPCDPRIPMWLDDGDGRFVWNSTDRSIECDDDQLAVIAMSVRFEEARLLTLFEDDIGMPQAFRTLARTGFPMDAVAALDDSNSARLVDIGLFCDESYVGYLQVGDRLTSCLNAYERVQLQDVPLAEALTSLDIGPGFEGVLSLVAS